MFRMIGRLIKLSISIVFYIIQSIVFSICCLSNRKKTALSIFLTYHSVKPGQSSSFDAQMDEIVKTGIPAFAGISQHGLLGRHHIIVTFDDGFQSVLENALPIMHAKKIPATIFVTTGCIGKSPEWITDPKHANAAELLMTEDQLKGLPANEVMIGSHTVSHPHLADVDTNTLREELADSKKRLEDILQRKVSLLALPYGSVDEERIEWFRQAGYERVFLNVPTFPATLTGRYFVGRIDTSPDDWMIEYKLKIRGGYQWLPWAIAVKQTIRRLAQGSSERGKVS